VARDRKRAKQRRERRGNVGAGRASEGAGRASEGADAASAQAASPGKLIRADLPGALDHAGAEVDEFDAALVRGAGGVTATPDTEAPEIEAPEDSPGNGPSVGTEDALQGAQPTSRRGAGDGGGDGGDGGAGGSGAGGGDHERPSGAPLRGGNRALAFVRASWAELQRVQWPDRRHVTQATAVVLGFVAIAGAYLGLADNVAKEIVELIL
jgi:preprotein translocase subunit SecE